MSHTRVSDAYYLKRNPTTWKTVARETLVIVLVAVLVSVVMKSFIARSFYIPSASMENTLQINDRVLVNELQPALFSLHRGDVVVFKDPDGWLPPAPPVHSSPVQQALTFGLDAVGLGASDSDQYLIKRVIGLPGDHVSCCTSTGRLQVNGKPLAEPYVLLPPGAEAVSSIPFDVTVPTGMVWVMGDNRYNSADSRYHQYDAHRGFVPLTDVVGTAFLITWPINHWSFINN